MTFRSTCRLTCVMRVERRMLFAEGTAGREAAGRHHWLCRPGREDRNWRNRGGAEGPLGTGPQRESWRCGSRQEFDSGGETGHRQASGGGEVEVNSRIGHAAPRVTLK